MARRFCGIGRGGDGAALEGGGLADLDVETALSGGNAALADSALVAVVDLLLRGADAAGAGAVADRRDAQAEAETAAALLALVLALILQGFRWRALPPISASMRLATDLGTPEGGVGTAL